MRNEDTIRAALGQALKDYHALDQDGPRAPLRQATGIIKALQAELSACLSAGAEPCEDCGGPPLGLCHFRATYDRGSKTFVPSKEYEVGCSVCIDHRALGTTRELAVQRYNDMQYLDPKPQAVEAAVAALHKVMDPDTCAAVHATQPFSLDSREPTPEEMLAYYQALRSKRVEQVLAAGE